MDSTGDDKILNIACDTYGNIYAVGTFNGPFSIYNRFNNGVDAIIPHDGNFTNGFIASFSSNGSFRWSVSIQGLPLRLTVHSFQDSIVVSTRCVRLCGISLPTGFQQSFSGEHFILMRLTPTLDQPNYFRST